MNTDDEKGQQMTPTPGSPLTFSEEASGGYELVRTPVDYDSEDVQLSARTDDGDVVMYLPEITYLDTQPWSVEIGLTPERLVQLRDALDNHLRDTGGPANRGDTPTVGADGVTAGHSVVGQQPTTLGQPPTVAQQATVVTVTVVTVALRERLRAALRRHIDPDDDTMPALDHGGFIWIDTDDVLDNLIKAFGADPDQLVYERDQAVAAVTRVRAECEAIGTPHICNAVDRILDTLNTPEQP